MKKDSQKPRKIVNKDNKSRTEEIKHLSKKSRSAALGLAVFFATSTMLTGCWPFPKTAQEKEKEEEQSYWSSGSSSYHSHYYGGWGNVFGRTNSSIFGGSTSSVRSGGAVSSFHSGGYSSSRGGSFGG